MNNTDNTSGDVPESSNTNIWSVNSWDPATNNETSWSNSYSRVVLAFSPQNENIIVPYPSNYYEQLENRLVNSIINESFYDKNPIKNIVSEEGIKSIKFSSWNINNPSKTCPIFLTDFKENDEIATLPCGHCFCKEAIMEWLTKENNLCPTCRHPLKFIEKKN